MRSLMIVLTVFLCAALATAALAGPRAGGACAGGACQLQLPAAATATAVVEVAPPAPAEKTVDWGYGASATYRSDGSAVIQLPPSVKMESTNRGDIQFLAEQAPPAPALEVPVTYAVASKAKAKAKATVNSENGTTTTKTTAKAAVKEEAEKPTGPVRGLISRLFHRRR